MTFYLTICLSALPFFFLFKAERGTLVPFTHLLLTSFLFIPAVRRKGLMASTYFSAVSAFFLRRGRGAHDILLTRLSAVYSFILCGGEKLGVHDILLACFLTHLILFLLG